MGRGISGGHARDKVSSGTFGSGEARDAAFAIGVGEGGGGTLERGEAERVGLLLDLTPDGGGKLHTSW